MNENLIAGYAEYTTADEFGATVVADAPGTIVLTISVATASALSGVSVSETVRHGC
ncbi:LxmA leader domain family RiPP [Streptacidiphilus carbonis]|uniref:LxmA leader domain family RiPP n=1 Tax=Streptacidiphilus carbonis TaxID=105422 RepID=UPI000A8F3564|nr:LxmA leader domain family RiPP [Streptacidiphilus carbonis]